MISLEHPTHDSARPDRLRRLLRAFVQASIAEPEMRKEPYKAISQYLLARAENGNRELARLFWTDWGLSCPQEFDPWVQLAVLEAAAGNRTLAESYAAKATALAPTDAGLKARLAKLWAEEGKK